MLTHRICRAIIPSAVADSHPQTIALKAMRSRSLLSFSLACSDSPTSSSFAPALFVANLEGRRTTNCAPRGDHEDVPLT